MILSIYHGQIRRCVEVIRDDQKNVKILCQPEDFYQIGTNLIHIALHAMKYRGTLTIMVRGNKECALVEKEKE